MSLKERKRHINLSKIIDISATIILFNEDLKTLRKTVESFLETPLKKELFLIDNSPTNILEKEFNHPEIHYIFSGENLGFAKGHNFIIDSIKNTSKYHVILNPDVEFKADVIPKLVKEIDQHKNVAMIAPKAVFPNGEFQYTSRKYPNLLEMISRRINIFKKYSQKKEYRDVDLTKPFYPDFIHGCFMLFKTKDFVKIGGFDERYFLYMEDVDICRKIDQIGKKKLYYPNVQITHIFKKESSNNLRLFFTHLNSSIKYFKKWGF